MFFEGNVATNNIKSDRIEEDRPRLIGRRRRGWRRGGETRKLRPGIHGCDVPDGMRLRSVNSGHMLPEFRNHQVCYYIARRGGRDDGKPDDVDYDENDDENNHQPRLEEVVFQIYFPSPIERPDQWHTLTPDEARDECCMLDKSPYKKNVNKITRQISIQNMGPCTKL